MRIRTIKPEFFTHEALFEAEKKEGLPLRLAFVGLWCCADREGRFRWEPRRLGVQILPYDGVDFSRVLHALTTRGFTVAYRVNDACFGCIPSFTRHQVINNRESPSLIPDFRAENAVIFKDLNEIDAWMTRAPHVNDACKGEGKGKEGREEEGIKDASKRFVEPTREELNTQAQTLNLPSSEVDKFVAFYGSNGWKVGKNKMKSWQHALSGWASRWRESNKGGFNFGNIKTAMDEELLNHPHCPHRPDYDYESVTEEQAEAYRTYANNVRAKYSK